MKVRLATVERALSAIALGALVACGPAPSNTQPDAGVKQLGAAYWGLADKACYHFSDGTADLHAMYIQIDDNMTFGGVTTYQLHYLTNGLEQGTDWVMPSGTSLLLYQHYTPPVTTGTTTTPDTTTTFTPPPVYLQEGLVATTAAKVTSTTAAATSNGVTTMSPLQYTVDVEASNPIMADGMAMLQATEFLITVFNTTTMGATTTKVWFAPMIGIVQLGQPNSAPPWLLTSIDQNVPATGTMTCL